MKKLIALLTLAVVSGFASFAVVKASAAADTIATIKSRYASINKNLGRYKKVNKELSGYSTEGGTMDAYFDGVSIKKIVAQFYGEMGRADEEYYYWDNKLIFVFRREQTYDRPLSGKVVSTKENRFYFSNGQLIRWLNEKGRQVPRSKYGFSEKEVEYLNSSRKFIELARS